MKTLNLIFSILFLFWCIIILIICNSDSKAVRLFQYGLGEKAFNFFWEMVILATIFNILARIFNQCNFYLVGAFGLIALFLTQIISAFIFAINLIIGYADAKEKNEHGARLLLTILTFPYIVFGILSSLCCYQTKIHRRIDRTQSKLQQRFLQIPLTNYGMIILFFNVMVSLSSLMLFSLFLAEKEYHSSQLILLTPLIPTILFAFALKFEKKWLFQLTFGFWGCFIFIFIACLLSTIIYNFTSTMPNLINLIAILSILLIFGIHGIIGFLSALSIYHKIEKKENAIASNFENQNFILLQELNVYHEIEQPLSPTIKVYSEIFDI
uniref:Transmembrane protein n=1 Tax=Panagrolaimus sp. PS1159 TaxID=55785 RepID=A0AC35FZZ3_9BILA